MNTKSAIKHLEKCKITDDKYKYCKLNQTWDNIISLLQQGEKYKQMSKELIKYFNSVNDDAVKKLKQKYFPKKGKSKMNKSSCKIDLSDISVYGIVKSQDFIAKMLRLIVLSLEKDWTLDYLIENIERSLETFHMTNVKDKEK